MYCSSCGVAVAQGLNYCNYCGAKLGEVKSDELTISPSGLRPEFLVFAMVVVFVFGLAAIALLLGVLKAVAQFDLPFLLATVMLSFTIMLVVEGVLIRLLFARKTVALPAVDHERLKEQTTQELVEMNTRALPEPVPSVTEHTTRTFDPVYSERNQSK